MNKIQDVVRQRRTEIGLSQPQLARRIGVSAQAIQQLEAGDVRRPRYLVELANALGLDPLALHEGRTVVVGPGAKPLPSPAMSSGRNAAASQGAGGDTVMGASEPPRPNAAFGRNAPMGARDLPVYASAQGGPDGMLVDYDPIEWIERPTPLAGVPNAFAMYVVNDSMEPRFRQGDLLLIHPQRPVRKGSDVLLITRAEDATEHEAFIKELVSLDTDKVKLRQLNPEKTFSIPRDKVSGLNLVVGVYYGH
ncbi:MAG: LexA family transcriptional regulator [Limibacillus sp.]|jgi:transcriptional regulator with XRE-family HTH domain